MNRKQRRETMRQIQSEDISLEVVHPDAAGIDIGDVCTALHSGENLKSHSLARCTCGRLPSIA